MDAYNAYLYNLAQKYPQVGATHITEGSNSGATKSAASGYSRDRQALISKGENQIMTTPLHQGNVGELLDVMTSVALMKGRQQGGGATTSTTPPPAAIGGKKK